MQLPRHLATFLTASTAQRPIAAHNVRMATTSTPMPTPAMVIID